MHKWGCQVKNVAEVKIISSAILSLQQKLGQTQEAMARQLGCTLGAYSKWVRGERTPNGRWLLGLLALCPDNESRRAFGLEFGSFDLTSARRGETSIYNDGDLPAPGPSPLTRQQRTQLCEEMQTAIGMICERAPDQVVADLARRIRRRAGTYGESKAKS
jgi:hypothetical protein